MKPIEVASVQFEHSAGDKKANLNKVAGWVEKAAWTADPFDGCLLPARSASTSGRLRNPLTNCSAQMLPIATIVEL